MAHDIVYIMYFIQKFSKDGWIRFTMYVIQSQPFPCSIANSIPDSKIIPVAFTSVYISKFFKVVNFINSLHTSEAVIMEFV